MRVCDWTNVATDLTGDPFAVALTLIPNIRDVVPECSDDVVTELEHDALGRLLLACCGDRVLLYRERPDGGRSEITEARLQEILADNVCQPREFIDQAIRALDVAVRGEEVRSIECGHIHLDRQLDRDQEIGTVIGTAVYSYFATRHRHAPLLMPMMDDDHVLVRLRPAQYTAFLAARFNGAPFQLIPESSPVIRGITVSLYDRLVRSAQRSMLAVRGGNLFYRLPDLTFCELFEDFQGSAASGCVLFETALLAYRTAPGIFDQYIAARFGTTTHIHIAAARILDDDQAHDVKVDQIANLYAPFNAITDPHRPDSEFNTVVDRVLPLGIGWCYPCEYFGRLLRSSAGEGPATPRRAGPSTTSSHRPFQYPYRPSRCNGVTMMRVCITGATGTVGHPILTKLHDREDDVVALGRRRPTALRERDVHLVADLADPVAVKTLSERLAADDYASVDAVVFAAGIDCRQTAATVDYVNFSRAMQVNCLAHLQLLRGLIISRPSDRPPLRVVTVSSDVLDRPTPDSVTYGATKAALEQALRHATADVPLSVLLVRLPNLGVPMRETAEGIAPPGTTQRRPSTLLDKAVGHMVSFVHSAPPPRDSAVELWP